MTDRALSGIKVLDFTQHVAGPYCTKVMADQGADVTKVERPGVGDVARRSGPYPGDTPHAEKSGLFLHLNTSKRSLTLDLASAAGRNIALQLAADADIVVESFRPGTMESFGLDYQSLKTTNPNLVMTSISNFGQTGPYLGYRGADIVFYGMGGEMFGTGLADREPIKLGQNVILYQAGATASVATLGALFLAQDPADGQALGQHVDVSLMETQVGSIDRRMTALIAYQYTGETSKREHYGGSSYPNGIYPCEDGYFALAGSRVYFPRSVRMLGSPQELEDPKWHTRGAQTDPYLKEEFEELFLPWILSQSKQHAWAVAQQQRVLSGPLNTMEDLSDEPFFNQRGVFDQIDHPVAGLLKQPGRPFLMSESPWELPSPAPTLGQHNHEILADLGYSNPDIVRLRQMGVI